MTIFKNFKEDIEGIRVSFLHLVYKNQSEGFFTDYSMNLLPVFYGSGAASSSLMHLCGPGYQLHQANLLPCQEGISQEYTEVTNAVSTASVVMSHL
jgi:hypothetical protein